MIDKPEMVEVKLTDVVAKMVDELAREQGPKSNKFYNRCHEELTLADFLKGVPNHRGLYVKEKWGRDG